MCTSPLNCWWDVQSYSELSVSETKLCCKLLIAELLVYSLRSIVVLALYCRPRDKLSSTAILLRIGDHNVSAMTKKVLQAIYNKYPANIAIVDGDGVIQSVNCAWKHYAVSNGGDSKASWAGVSYLQVCEDSARGDHSDAKAMLAGFDRIISKKMINFSIFIPAIALCSSPGILPG